MVENKTTSHFNEVDECCRSKPVFQSRNASPQSMADRNSLTREAIRFAQETSGIWEAVHREEFLDEVFLRRRRKAA